MGSNQKISNGASNVSPRTCKKMLASDAPHLTTDMAETLPCFQQAFGEETLEELRISAGGTDARRETTTWTGDEESKRSESSDGESDDGERSAPARRPHPPHPSVPNVGFSTP